MLDRQALFRMRHRSAGFTLIECLLAGMVLAIFGAAVAVTLTQSVAANGAIDERKRAALWLDEVLTRIDLIGPSRITLEGPTEGQLDARYSWSSEIEAEPLNPDLYRITVTVTWAAAQGQRSVKGYTMLYDPLLSRDAYLQWDDLS